LKSVLLSPHNDDESLFAAFLAMRHDPTVVICFRSHIQEKRGTRIVWSEREAETSAALDCLGISAWEQWEYLDTGDDAFAIATDIHRLSEEYEHCFAPAIEAGGHEQHSLIGMLALIFFGPERLTQYLTYTRHGGRSTQGTEVEYDPWMVKAKLEALACYGSQILEMTCTEHFVRGLKEYVA
jgi:LmbE family N-acetylglucosaminyl deacetylase